MGDFFFSLLAPDAILAWALPLAALATVLSVGVPIVLRGQRRERMKNVVDYRAALRAEEKKRLSTPQGGLAGQAPPAKDASRSIGDFFKMQKYGSSGFRTQLMTAGLRKPHHVVVFLVARVACPILFMALAILLVSLMKKPLPDAVKALTVMAVGIMGFVFPNIWVKNIALKRLEEFRLRFPDALDLMLVCVEGGQGIEASIQTVTRDIAKSSTALGEEFGLLGAELSFLGDRAQALRNFAVRVPENGAKSFASALIQAEKYGTPMGQALRVLSTEMRDARFSDAEKRAAALPPKLTVPMILFFMPTLFIVILGPAVLQAVNVSGQMGN